MRQCVRKFVLFFVSQPFCPFLRVNPIVPYGIVPFETLLRILVHFTTVHNGTKSISKVNEMDEKTKILLVRAIYWIGVVLDALFALEMTVITVFGESFAVYTLPEETAIDLPYRYAMGIAAAMMWGWTGLLIWGVQDPLERRGTLLLTAFPVITGLMLSNVFAASNSLISSTSEILRPIIFIALFGMFTSGYFLAEVAQKGD